MIYYDGLIQKASMKYGDWQIGIYTGPTTNQCSYPMACIYEKYIGNKNAETIEIPAFPPLVEFGEKYEDATEVYADVCFLMEGALEDAVKVKTLYLRKPKRFSFGYVYKPNENGHCREYRSGYTYSNTGRENYTPTLSGTVEEVRVEADVLTNSTDVGMYRFKIDFNECAEAPYFPALRRVFGHGKCILCDSGYGRRRKWGPLPTIKEDRMFYVDDATIITDTAKAEMGFLCCAPKLCLESDEKMSDNVKLSLVGGYLLYPEYYTPDDAQKYEEYLDKYRTRILEAAVEYKAVRILNKYFEGNRKCSGALFEKLMAKTKEHDECYQVLISNYDMRIDREKEALRKERLDEKKLLNPNMVKNIRESWRYKGVNNDGISGVMLTAYIGDPYVSELYVPALVGKKPVIGIDNATFNSWKGKKLILHDGIIVFNKGALSHMDNVEEIILPSGMTEIVEDCFQKDEQLKEIVLPDAITLFGKGAFYKCSSLKAINIPKGVDTISQSCFQCTGFTEFVVPENVKTIMSDAFKGCSNLKRFVAKHKINYGFDVLSGTAIEKAAFHEGMDEIPVGMFCCSTIEQYEIKPDVNIIGRDAFSATKQLTGEIIVPSNVTCIEMNAYSHSAIASIQSEAQYVGEGAFADCEKLVEASFPNITHLNGVIFEECISLKRVYCPNVIEIDSGAFGGCKAMEELHVGNLSFVDSRAFTSRYIQYGSGDSGYVKALKRIVVHNGNAERVRRILMRHNEELFEMNPLLEIVDA